MYQADIVLLWTNHLSKSIGDVQFHMDPLRSSANRRRGRLDVLPKTIRAIVYY